jgi:hypothetical protein
MLGSENNPLRSTCRPDKVNAWLSRWSSLPCEKLRTKEIRSATSAMCGITSLNLTPGSTVGMSSNVPRISAGASGLGSNESMCVTPPSHPQVDYRFCLDVTCCCSHRSDPDRRGRQTQRSHAQQIPPLPKLVKRWLIRQRRRCFLFVHRIPSFGGPAIRCRRSRSRLTDCDMRIKQDLSAFKVVHGG